MHKRTPGSRVECNGNLQCVGAEQRAFEATVDGAHDDAVAQGGEPQVQRRHHVRVLAHLIAMVENWPIG